MSEDPAPESVPDPIPAPSADEAVVPPPYPVPPSAPPAQPYAAQPYTPADYATAYPPQPAPEVEQYWGYGGYAPPPQREVNPNAPAFRSIPAWGWVTALIVILGGGVISAFAGQLTNYLFAAAQTVPFAMIGLFAYVGWRHTWGLVLAGISLTLFFFVACGFTVLMSLMALMAQGGALDSGGASFKWPASGSGQLISVLAWCGVSLFCGLLMLVQPVRRALATRLPLDPESPVHAIGLATIVPLMLVGFGQLIATGGRPSMLTMVQHSREALKTTADDIVGGMILTLIWTIPCALVAIGWPLARSLPEALKRVGLVKPTARQLFGGIITALAMVVVFQGLDWALNALWDWTKWPRTDADAFEQLLKPLITPTGAVLIGVTAGLGEEVVVRGVLQPRFGIVLSNLFFVSLHAFQYGFDGLLSVFAAGLVLGVVRARTNTTTSAITHGTYDFILVLYSWYAGS